MFFRMQLPYLIFFFVGFSYPSTAFIESKIRFEHISIENGLDHNSVNTITQDSAGFMWFGTRAGLNRFDGESFVTYSNDALDPSTLVGHNITAICPDKAGNIWIGTNGNGLSRFSPDKETFTNFTEDHVKPNSLHNNHILSIFCDSEGQIWIGTSAGPTKFLSDSEGFKRIPFKDNGELINNESVTAFAEIKPGVIWCATNIGSIFQISMSENVLSKVRLPLRRAIFYDIHLDINKNAVWIGTLPRGLYRYDIETDNWDEFGLDEPHKYRTRINGINNIVQNSSGHIWIGSVQGLSKYEPENNRYIVYPADRTDPSSLSDELIQTLFLDRQGILWIGTNTKGVDKYDPSLNRFELISAGTDSSNGLISSKIFDIKQGDSNKIIVSTIGGGFSRIDPSSRTYENFYSIDNDPRNWSRNYLSKVIPDTNGRVWLTTFDCGIYYFNMNDKTFKHYKGYHKPLNGIISNTFHSVLKTKDGSIWFGTSISGFIRYNPDKDNFTHYFYDGDSIDFGNDNSIYAMIEDKKGTIWLGSYFKGIYKFDRKTGTFENFKVGHSPEFFLTSNSILSLFEDHSGNIWIGTRGGGLCRMDSIRKQIINIDLGDDYSTFSVFGILQDMWGYLWLSTNKGVIKLDPKSNEVTLFDWSDGTQGDYYYSSALYGNDGYMYFGGSYGITRFHPDQITTNRKPASLIFTDIKINHEPIGLRAKSNTTIKIDKPIHMLEALELSNDENTIELTFALLNFSAPHKNTYMYNIDGFTKGWTSNGYSNKISLVNLPHGEYELQVKGFNNDGISTGKPASLLISILPPFWKTVWFKLMIYFTISLFIIGLFQVRIRSVRRKAKRVAEKEKFDLELEFQQRELMLKSMDLIEKQDFLEATLSDLESLVEVDEDQRLIKLRQVIKTLTKLVSFNHVWEEFEKWFSKIHTGFISRIQKDFPNLTKREIRICAMLRLSLSSKEIASFMHIEISSVEIYRYRIRKKLELSKGENLVNFLSKY